MIQEGVVNFDELKWFVAKKLAAEHNAVLIALGYSQDNTMNFSYKMQVYDNEEEVHIFDFEQGGDIGDALESIGPEYTFLHWNYKDCEKGHFYITCIKAKN